MLVKITPERAREIDDAFGDTFFETITLALIDEIPAEDMGALEEVLRLGDSEALEKFLRARIPEMDTIIAESIAPARTALDSLNAVFPNVSRLRASEETEIPKKEPARRMPEFEAPPADATMLETRNHLKKMTSALADKS